jgi:hypothetical protein
MIAGSQAIKVTADNPFETRKNKTRFSVLGRKVKGTVVKTGKSNQVRAVVCHCGLRRADCRA